MRRGRSRRGLRFCGNTYAVVEHRERPLARSHRSQPSLKIGFGDVLEGCPGRIGVGHGEKLAVPSVEEEASWSQVRHHFRRPALVEVFYDRWPDSPGDSLLDENPGVVVRQVAPAGTYRCVRAQLISHRQYRLSRLRMPETQGVRLIFAPSG